MSEQGDVRMWLQAEADACTCAKTYATYEGPEVDCPVHGAVKALNEVMRARDLLLWLHAEAVWRLEMERLAHAVTTAQRDELLATKGRQFARGWGDR